LIYNAACNPTDDKFKSVKLSNTKINAALVSISGAMEAMEALGWHVEDDMLVCNGKANMQQVRREPVDSTNADFAKFDMSLFCQSCDAWMCQQAGKTVGEGMVGPGRLLLPDMACRAIVSDLVSRREFLSCCLCYRTDAYADCAVS
jgi:PUB domain